MIQTFAMTLIWMDIAETVATSRLEPFHLRCISFLHLVHHTYTLLRLLSFKTEHLTMDICYALKHRLTYQAFQDLLRLISLHCPQPYFCELSVLKVKALFVAIEDKIVYVPGLSL